MNPVSRFLRLNNRPIIDSNGKQTRGSLELHYWEWQGRQPTFLFCHGGMLHGRCYDRIIRQSLADYHVISIDQRGHGQSEKHPLPYRFTWFGGDLLEFIEQLQLNTSSLVGIGHSLGAHAMILATSIASKRLFQSIILLDPAIYSSSIYRSTLNTIDIQDQNQQWTSIDDMFNSMNKPERLGHWPQDILRDYCTYALNDQYQLQCRSELATYLYLASTQPESNLYSIIKHSKFIHQIPIDVLRAPISMLNNRRSITPTAVDLAQWFAKGNDILLPAHVTHSFPTEEPELIIDFLKNKLSMFFSHL